MSISISPINTARPSFPQQIGSSTLKVYKKLAEKYQLANRTLVLETAKKNSIYSKIDFGLTGLGVLTWLAMRSKTVQKHSGFKALKKIDHAINVLGVAYFIITIYLRIQSGKMLKENHDTNEQKLFPQASSSGQSSRPALNRLT